MQTQTHTYDPDEDRCTCGGVVVYFENDGLAPDGNGCEVEGVPWGTAGWKALFAHFASDHTNRHTMWGEPPEGEETGWNDRLGAPAWALSLEVLTSAHTFDHNPEEWPDYPDRRAPYVSHDHAEPGGQVVTDVVSGPMDDEGESIEESQAMTWQDLVITLSHEMAAVDRFLEDLITQEYGTNDLVDGIDARAKERARAALKLAGYTAQRFDDELALRTSQKYAVLRFGSVATWLAEPYPVTTEVAIAKARDIGRHR